MDDRDERIARLEALLAKETAAPKPGGGAAVGTLKVLGTLAAVVIGGLVLLVAIGSALPDQEADKPYAERVKAACEEQAGHLGEAEVMECQIQIMAGELYRQRSEGQALASRDAGRP